jgi:hypothetical protein
MNIRLTSNSAANLGGTQGTGINGINWGSDSGAAKPLFTLDNAVKQSIVANGFANAVNADPALLKLNIADASRFINVPATSLEAAFKALAAQTGAKFDAKKPIGDVLRSVPNDQAKAIFTKWFSALPPTVQQVMTGVGIGLILATEGPRGLAERFKLDLQVVKEKNGSLTLSLLPNNKTGGILGKATGKLRIPLDGKGQISLGTTVNTNGDAQLTAGLKLAMGASTFNLTAKVDTQKPGTINPSVTVPVGDAKGTIGVVFGEKAPVYSAKLEGKVWSVNAQTDLGATYKLEGKLQLSF